jgi:hypothetical protein
MNKPLSTYMFYINYVSIHENKFETNLLESIQKNRVMDIWETSSAPNFLMSLEQVG